MPPPQVGLPRADSRLVSPQIETEVVFITPEALGQDCPVKPIGQVDQVSQDRVDRLAEPVRLYGHERKTRQGNKQWVVAGAPVGQENRPVELIHQDKLSNKALDNQDSPVKPADLLDPHKPVESVRPAEPVRLFGHEKKTRQGNKQWVLAGVHASPVKPVSQDKQTEPVQLVGHEKKTRQGNKQWVVAGKPVSQGSAVKPFGLVGHEKKTKRGNRQWVVAGLTPRRRVSRRNSRTKHRPSLVSFNGGRYTMDYTGRRLKRLSTSSSQLACLSPAITGYLGGMASSSVKRMKARYVY